MVNITKLFPNAVKLNEGMRDGVDSEIYYSKYSYNRESYIVRFIIDDRPENDIRYMLHAFSTKKSGVSSGQNPTSSQPRDESIADLLKTINSIPAYRNDLPADVFKTLNPSEKRGDSTISNRKHSIGLSTQDIKGRTLSKQQQEYFKNSKARDEDGNLKVLYHGSTFAPFYEFDSNKAFIEGDWGKGFYSYDKYDDVSRNYEGRRDGVAKES